MTLSKKQTEQRNSILEELYLHGAMSRADLARRLQITPATMTLIAGNMLQEGSIKELGDSSINRKKVLLDVTAHQRYYIGVELTASKLFLCLTDNLGTCLASQKLSFDTQTGSQVAAQAMLLQAIQIFIAENKQYPIAGIGVAVPGHATPGTYHFISNNPFWAQFDLEDVARAFDVPVFLKNNVKCMALRELYLGQDKQTSNFLFMNLKHGLFASYVYKGEIYGDSNHLVGEVGHVVVNPSGEQCELCGQAGCLQTYVSITWILKKARYAFEAQATPYLKLLVQESKDIELSHVLTAYKMGDEVVQQILEQALSYLAVQLHNVQMMLDIDTIYVHGRLFQEPEIMDKLQAKLNQSTTIVQPNREMTRHVKAYNPLLGALGAAAYAMVKDYIRQEETA